MSGIVNAFEEFKQTSKINNVIIDCSWKNKKIILFVYCIEKVINILNEKIDFWTYVASTKLPGGNMGSSPQTNINFISTFHLHLNLSFYFQEEKDNFFFICIEEYL